MKQMYGENNSQNEELARNFVQTAFEKKLLAEQIDSFYDSVDDLGAEMDVESRKKLFENASIHMKKLAGRLEKLESQLEQMLPALEQFRDTMDDESEATRLQQIKSIADGAAAMTNPIQVARLKPETPTLMAMEPAPMVPDDEEYDSRYDDGFATEYMRSEEEEEADFEHPAPPLIESQTSDISEDDTETISIHDLDAADITPPVLFEKSAEERPISLTAPFPTAAEVANSLPPGPASDGAYSQSQTTDSSGFNANEADESWAKLPAATDSGPEEIQLNDEEREAIESLELATPDTDAQILELTEPAPGEPGNLASVLEPETEVHELTLSKVPADPSQWDEEEPPTINLGSSLEGASEEEHILFWKQQTVSAGSDETHQATHEAVTAPPRPVAAHPEANQEPIALRELFSEEDNLDHIEDYGDNDEQTDDEQTEETEMEAESDTDEVSAVYPLEDSTETTLEQDLYEMLGAHPVAQQFPKGAKQTLVGLGTSTIEKVNAIATEADPVSNEGTN